MLGKLTLEDYPNARIRKMPPLYQMNMDSFSLRLNLLKDTIMLLFWSTIRQGTNGFMECRSRIKLLMLLNNGTATLPIYEPSINWFYLFVTMQEKINPETSRTSLNPWENETISVLLMSNDRLGMD